MLCCIAVNMVGEVKLQFFKDNILLNDIIKLKCSI